MDLRQLRYFVQTVEAKSLTRAAEQLHLAQPALTLQMKRLEEELGEVLLLRHARGVAPTEAGTRFAAHARAILQQVEAAKADMKTLKGEPQGAVRLGMPRSVSEMLAVEVIEAARAALPKVSIGLFEQLSDDLNESLLNGRLDLIFSYNAQGLRRAVIEPVLVEKLCFVTRAGGKAAAAKIRFVAAAQSPLILPSPPHVLRRLLEEAAIRSHIELRIAHDIDSAQLIADMVEAGLGDTILPFANVQRAVASGRLIARRIIEPEITRQLHLAYPKQALSKAQAAVRDLLLRLIHAYAKRHASAGMIASAVDIPTAPSPEPLRGPTLGPAKGPLDLLLFDPRPTRGEVFFLLPSREKVACEASRMRGRSGNARASEPGEGAAGQPTAQPRLSPTAFARRLRREQTALERKLWSVLRNRRFRGFKFRRQQPIGPYIADFVSFERKFIIELDGSQHALPENVAHDAARSRFLEAQGFRVRRYWNSDLIQHFEAAMEALYRDLEE